MASGLQDLQRRKRELLAYAAIYREDLANEVVHLQRATDWISRALYYAKMVSPVLAVAAPLAGWLLRPRRRKAASEPVRKRSLLTRVIAGYQLARQMKPVWEGFRRARHRH